MPTKLGYDQREGLCTLVSSHEMAKIKLQIVVVDWERNTVVTTAEGSVLLDSVG